VNTFYPGGHFILDSLFGSGTPASYELGLCSAEPSHSAITNEISGSGGYTRLTITNNATNFPNAATVGDSVVKSNGVAFEWSPATGDWDVPTHWFLYDAINTRALVFGTFDHYAAIAAGDIFRISAGGLRIIIK